MLKLLKSLIAGKSKTPLSDHINSESEATEKKKCKTCLRRINFDYVRCPFCRGSNFYEN